MTFKSLESHLEDAKKLVAEHGHFPTCAWLRKNGYQSLYQMSRLHKKAFSKFPMLEGKYRHLGDWLKIARKLAKENNGKIPTVTWLRDNGFSMLSRQMQRNPQSFAKMRQERHFRRPDEWVNVAEKLAKKHKGLPNSYWLQNKENGYKALDKVMRRYPKLFAHIPHKRTE